MHRILIVDDQPDFRATLSGLLTDAGHMATAVSNEGEALGAAVQEPFDFACIDVRLHEGGEEDESGLSLAMALRSLNPQIRVILLTRYVATRQVVRSVRYIGIFDFIEKTPDVGEQILKAIAEAHDEVRRPKYGVAGGATRLSLSLEPGLPVVMRAQGSHAYAGRTAKRLDLDIHRYARQTEILRQDPRNSRFHAKEIGTALWRDIFAHPEVARAYLEAKAQSQSFSLLFETPRELLQIPLELVFSDVPAEYLVLQHPLTRFVRDAIPRREAISPSLMALSKQLRVLIVASNTQPSIPGVDAEAQELYKYLRDQDFIPVHAKLIPTERATYERVRLELSKHTYDILHYAGHGTYNASSPEESSLYFWANDNRQGNIVRLEARELNMLLGSSETRLVYLSASFSTMAIGQVVSLDSDFVGLADAVVQAGVPTVVGFRWPPSDEWARKLALAFYSSLLEQGNPEVALWRARCELAAIDRSTATWLSPILVHQV